MWRSFVAVRSDSLDFALVDADASDPLRFVPLLLKAAFDVGVLLGTDLMSDFDVFGVLRVSDFDAVFAAGFDLESLAAAFEP